MAYESKFNVIVLGVAWQLQAYQKKMAEHRFLAWNNLMLQFHHLQLRMRKI